MGLKDTSPQTTEIDSGLGEAPPTCDKKMYSPTKLEKVSLQPALIPEEDEQVHLEKPLKKNKKDLEPDKILDQKQKKSLEKVAEWLMNVPSEQSLELENLEEDGNDSDSYSSSSTIDLGPLRCETNPTRGHAKALEDQVFGAIYKRERRGKAVTKLTEAEPAMVSLNLSVKSTSEDERRDDKEEEHSIREQEKNTSSNVLKGKIEVAEDFRGIVEPTHMSENDKNNKDEVPHLVSDIEQPQPETKVKRTRSTLQHVDSDLLKCTQKKPENSEQKKSTQRGCKSIKTEKAKSRISKPLVLVTVENVESSPEVRPRSEDVQVHIESYPSSCDQEFPLGRNTRRSRRLQLFSKEDNGKEKSRSSVPVIEHTSKDPNFECKILDKVESPGYQDQKQGAGRNGCIYNQYIEEIENMESGQRTFSLRPDEDPKPSPSEVPNTETTLETGCCIAVVPSSSQIALVEPTDQPPDAAQLLTELTEPELEQRNDSEIDTEQLLRSFKATKRKSFHLGSGPNMKRSRLSVEGNAQSAGAEENQDVSSSDESAPSRVAPVGGEITNNQALIDSQSMSGSGLILPSYSPGLKRKASGLQPLELDNCVLGNSASSPLPPNNQSKLGIQTCPPLVPTKGDSAVCFATEKPSQNSESQTDFMMSEDARGGASPRSVNGSASKEALTAPSSLTPDGLGTPEPRGAATYSQGSRALGTGRKRKKAQKLDSSSESSADEEPPHLTKIFDKPAPPGANAARPPACPSPDFIQSSQASVDLFATPNDCKFKVLHYFHSYSKMFMLVVVEGANPFFFFLSFPFIYIMNNSPMQAP